MTLFDGQAVTVPQAMNYAYAPLNVTGKYRCRCDDFIVVEQSLPPTHEGEHDHLVIESGAAIPSGLPVVLLTMRVCRLWRWDTQGEKIDMQ